jgi:AcrR family transcriptional regulator
MPRLWTRTIEEHRHAVREATLDTAAALASRHGLRSLTMSQIATETGIGRATLYKYFPDVEAILIAWHDRQIARHLEYLAELSVQGADTGKRLESVLEAFALIRYEHRGAPLGELLHRGEHVARAQTQLRRFIRGLLLDAARDGHVRTDVSADELATYCVHALSAAGALSSKAAVRRLASLTIAGLR